jgi:MFS transporter, FHS family, L-fucose permease
MALPENSSIHKTTENNIDVGNKYLVSFILVTSLFFLWGFAHNLDGILIPHLRKALQLSNRQSSLVDVAVFFAYFIMGIPAGMILKKWGYKTGIIIGLLIFAIGVFMFIPAANTREYSLFLGGLFVLGCGLTILETAANPYAAILGNPETSSARLNLAQSFNGLATFIAPIVGSIFILSGKEYTNEQLAAMPEVDKIAYLSNEAASVKSPYFILGICLLLVTAAFYFVKFPEINDGEEDEKISLGNFLKAFRYRHLSWAVIAQFFYVGAQVCITSFFIRVAIKGGGIDEKTAGYYLGIYGLLFMIGRFAGTFFMRFIEPQKLLAIYTVICIILSIFSISLEGKFVVYALGGLGFFMSIMFPTIFSLGIKNLGADTKSGASLIVMAIVGGAFFPYLMGWLIDFYGDDIQRGYYVPLICFFFVLYFGIKGYKVKEIPF